MIWYREMVHKLMCIWIAHNKRESRRWLSFIFCIMNSFLFFLFHRLIPFICLQMPTETSNRSTFSSFKEQEQEKEGEIIKFYAQENFQFSSNESRKKLLSRADNRNNNNNRWGKKEIKQTKTAKHNRLFQFTSI